ncbi:Uncharacterised protein [Vibrio cholerae]|nr:Uncharacterised protein [Vibrio cholerae]
MIVRLQESRIHKSTTEQDEKKGEKSPNAHQPLLSLVMRPIIREINLFNPCYL